jgi:hypothetical protein
MNKTHTHPVRLSLSVKSASHSTMFFSQQLSEQYFLINQATSFIYTKEGTSLTVAGEAG